MKKIFASIKNFIDDSDKISLLLVFSFFISLLMILKQACLQLVPISDIKVLEGVIFFIPETKRYIVWYMVSVPAAFLLFLSSLAYKNIFWNKVESLFSLLKRKNIYYYFISGILAANILFPVIAHNSKGSWPFLLCAWLIMFFYPFIYGSLFKINLSFYKKPFFKKHIFIFSAILVFVYLLWALKPLIFEKLRLINEFWDIPTFTVTKEGKFFNNTEWINANNFIGFHGKVDADGFDNYKTVFADVKSTPEFERYLEDATKRESLISPFFYIEGKGIGFALALTEEYKNALYRINFSDDEKERLNESFIEIDSKQYDLSKRNDKIYNPNYKEMKKFAKNNSYQIHWQILNRGYIHHHNHIMSAINELNLGRPVGEIFMQYGYLNTFLMYKILSLFDNVNYGAYNKIVYGFYLLYFIMAALILWFIGKRWHYIAGFSLLFVIAVNLLSYQYLYIGPGGSPFRHFFDYPVFFLLYLYFSKNNKLFFIAALLLCVAAVLNNVQFGFILAIALLVTVFVKSFLSKERKLINFETSAAFSAFICCIAVAVFFQQGTMNVTFGFLSGFLSFQIPTKAIVISMLVIFTSYFAFLFMKKENKALAYVFLFALIYTQGLFVFWFRSYAFYHLLPFMAIYAFMAIIFLKALFDKYPKHESKIMLTATFALLISFIFSIFSFTETRRSFNRVLDSHKLFEWNLPGSNFISDANPEYFEDSAKLIQKYSPGEKGIYIISKYDNFLPLVSQRYSSLPVIDLQWYLNTERDIKNICAHIKNASPEYIFADRDLADRVFEFDIINAETEVGYLNEESRWRVQRLKQMRKIFIDATENYSPVESSRLLTVYEKNS